MITKEQFDSLTSSKKLLTFEEECDLFEYYNANKTTEARNQIALKNDGLIKMVASQFKFSKLDYEDLCQEGYTGIFIAIDRFDYTRGFKFSTYAYHWIYQAITRYIYNNDRTIRIPVHIGENMIRVKKFMREYEVLHNGKDPSVGLIAKGTGLTQESVLQAQEELSHDVVSYDAEVKNSDGDDTPLLDFFPDKETNVEEEVARNCDFDKMRKKMKEILSPREYDIICARYGFSEGDGKTLQEIGDAYGLSRERIRQIEKLSLGKLKRNREMKMIGREYVARPTASGRRKRS